MQNGNISEFLKRDGQFNRRPLVRLNDHQSMTIPTITSISIHSSWTSSVAWITFILRTLCTAISKEYAVLM